MSIEKSNQAYSITSIFINHIDSDASSETGDLINDLNDLDDDIDDSTLDESDVLTRPTTPETEPEHQETEYVSVEGFNLNDRFGEIISIELLDYEKYRFTLLITTNKYEMKIITGGEPEDIYKYELWMPDWAEHESAIIRDVKIIRPMFFQK